MPKLLTRLKIDEVSAVDAGAGKGVRIMLMKRASRPDATPADTLRAFPNPRSFNAVYARMEAEAMAKVDDGDDDSGDRENGDHNGGGGIADHSIAQLARLLVASGKFGDHAQALDHLLNTPHGAALHRTRAHKAKDHPMQDSLTAIMKDAGIAATCAIIIAKGSTTISEHELVEAATKVAAERHPDMSPAQAFERVYSDQSEEGLALRKAVSIAKAMPFVADLTPLVVGGLDATHEAINATEQSEAYEQLKRIGKDRWPTASEAVQFTNAISDPANAELARKAHRRPTAPAGSAYPFPR
jgi:hypothetical protein